MDDQIGRVNATYDIIYDPTCPWLNYVYVFIISNIIENKPQKVTGLNQIYIFFLLLKILKIKSMD